MRIPLIALCFLCLACSGFTQDTTTVSNPTVLWWDAYTSLVLDTNMDGTGLILDESLFSDMSSIQDADGDTMVQTEESADEDIIRFDVAGVEEGYWNATGFYLSNLLTIRSPAATDPTIEFYNTTSSAVEGKIYYDESADDLVLYTSLLGSASDIVFAPNATIYFRMTGAGHFITGLTNNDPGIATFIESKIDDTILTIGNSYGAGYTTQTAQINFSFNSTQIGDIHSAGAAIVAVKEGTWLSSSTRDGALSFRTVENAGTAANALYIDPQLNVGLQTTDPLAPLHVLLATAGGVSVYGNALLVLENDSHSYLQFSTPNDKGQGLRFGDPENNSSGAVVYNHGTDTMSLTAAGQVGITIVANAYVGIEDVTPEAQLTVGNTSSMTTIDGVDDLLVGDDAEIDGDLYVEGSYNGDGGNLTNIGVSAATAITISAKATENIDVGEVVYISGATGQFPQVSLADNTNSAKEHAIGVAAESKTTGQTILIRIVGELTGLNTSDWADGDILYLSTVGTMVNAIPTTGMVLHIADVSYDHGSQGKIIVHISIQHHYIAMASGEDLEIRMGDSAGTNKISFEDYADVEVASLNSDGDLMINSLIFSSGSDADIIRDEDNMSSNDDNALATQQSIKAYIDAADVAVAAGTVNYVPRYNVAETNFVISGLVDNSNTKWGDVSTTEVLDIDGRIQISDAEDDDWLTLYAGSGYGVVGLLSSGTPNGLWLVPNAVADCEVFAEAIAGRTKEFNIYGYRSGDSLRSLQIGVGVDVADTASFKGVSNYYFDGNIGVGTNAPEDLIHGVQSNDGAKTALVLDNSYSSSASVDETTELILSHNGSTAVSLVAGKEEDFEAGGTRSSFFSIWTRKDGSHTEKFRIDSDGKVGIGITPTYRLHVVDNRGTNGDNYAAMIANLGNNTDRYVLILQGGLDAPADETTTFIDFRDGNGDSFATIEHDNGTLQIAQASGVYRFIQHGDNLSTFTVKKDITSTTLDATDIARRIAVFDYTLAEGGNRVIGQFTADQIESIFPEMVSEHTYQKTFVDDDGVTQTVRITQKTIQLLRLIPVLVKAFQEQQVQLDENTANIAVLEANQKVLWLAVFGSLLLGGASGFTALKRRKK